MGGYGPFSKHFAPSSIQCRVVVTPHVAQKARHSAIDGRTTQQNAAMFEETSAAHHELEREAKALAESAGRFRFGEGDAMADAGWQAAVGSPQLQRA